MTQIKNIGRTNLSFTTGSKDGVPVIVDLRVGETKNIDIDPDSPQVKARKNSQQILVGRAAGSANNSLARTATRANRIEDPAPKTSEGS